MKIRALCLALLSAYAGVCYAVLPSQVLVSTFGPNESYGDSVTTIQNFPSGFFFDQAVRFQVSASDYWLDAMRLPLYRQTNVNLPITLHLATDSSGVPGADIASLFESGNVPVHGPFQKDTAPPTEFPWPTHQVLLHAGTPYWLYITASPGNNYDVEWYINSIGAQGNYASRGTGYGDTPSQWHSASTFPTQAFSILGTAVPEPGTGMLLFVATSAMAISRRRH